MADEETNEETETETPTVEVTVEEAPENPEPEEVTEVVEAPDQTVIVEADDPGVSEAELDRWTALERWKAEIEGTVLGLVQAVETVHTQVVEAEVAAEEAQETATDAFAEAEASDGPEEEHAEDEAPSSARTHWLFESRGDRRARKHNN